MVRLHVFVAVFCICFSTLSTAQQITQSDFDKAMTGLKAVMQQVESKVMGTLNNIDRDMKVRLQSLKNSITAVQTSVNKTQQSINLLTSLVIDTKNDVEILSKIQVAAIGYCGCGGCSSGSSNGYATPQGGSYVTSAGTGNPAVSNFMSQITGILGSTTSTSSTGTGPSPNVNVLPQVTSLLSGSSSGSPNPSNTVTTAFLGSSGSTGSSSVGSSGNASLNQQLQNFLATLSSSIAQRQSTGNTNQNTYAGPSYSQAPVPAPQGSYATNTYAGSYAQAPPAPAPAASGTNVVCTYYDPITGTMICP